MMFFATVRQSPARFSAWLILLTERTGLPISVIGFLLSMLVLGIASIATVFGVIAFSLVNPAPLSYTSTRYQATPDAVCPGDVLTFTPIFTVRDDTAAHVEGSRTIWSSTTNGVAKLRNGTYTKPIPLELNYPDEAYGQARAIPVQYVVEDLPAGDYWIVSATWGIRTNVAKHQVRFSIPSSCFEGATP